MSGRKWPTETLRVARGHRFWPTEEQLRGMPPVDSARMQREAERVVRVHFFVGGMDWWVVGLDVDPDGRRVEALAYVENRALGGQARGGWHDTVDLVLLEASTLTGAVVVGGQRRRFPQPVERDLWWRPQSFDAVRPTSWVPAVDGLGRCQAPLPSSHRACGLAGVTREAGIGGRVLCAGHAAMPAGVPLQHL